MKKTNYTILFSKHALKDIEKLKNVGLYLSAQKILDLMVENPFIYPPSYEKLIGDLKGFYSRRINKQHRIVYKVIENKKELRVYRMWTHYEK